QMAIDRGLRRPSECDIVVVILWSRMGTPLSAEYHRENGTRYGSGTEWEYEDALQSQKRPEILVYRRTSDAPLDTQDPDYEERRLQLRRVEDFFAGFRNSDGSLQRGFNSYKDPSEFRK